MGLLMPESNDLPSSLVTVWPVPVVFFHTTAVPALIVNEVGLKAKVPLLSVIIMTVCVEPPVPVVAAGVGVLPLLVPEVLPPPQAAKSTSAASAARHRQA